MTLNSNPEKLAEVDTLLAKYGEDKLLQMVRKKYKVGQPGGAATPRTAKTKAVLEIEALYRKHNPEKLAEVDGLLTKYGEAKLLAMIKKKYRGVATPAPRAAPEPAAPTRAAVPVDFDGPSAAKKTRTRFSPEAKLRAQLAPMKVKALKLKAAEVGVDKEAIADADDAEDIKATVIKLIIDHVTAAQKELQGMKVRALKERAKAAGVGAEAIADADDADDVKQEVIKLIMAAEAAKAKAPPSAEDVRRKELSAMKLSALKAAAAAAGVDPEALADADDTTDVKRTVIHLILRAERDGGAKRKAAEAAAQQQAKEAAAQRQAQAQQRQRQEQARQQAVRDEEARLAAAAREDQERRERAVQEHVERTAREQEEVRTATISLASGLHSSEDTSEIVAHRSHAPPPLRKGSSAHARSPPRSSATRRTRQGPMRSSSSRPRRRHSRCSNSAR